MKVSLIKKILPVFVSVAMLLTVSPFASAVSSSSKVVDALGAYTLQKTEEQEKDVRYIYQDDAGNTLALTYLSESQSVSIESYGQNGKIAIPDDAVASFLSEQLQQPSVPTIASLCAQCGYDTVFCYEITFGPWVQVSSKMCGHGGIWRYNDVTNQRTITMNAICSNCGQQTTKTDTSSAVQCYYKQRWYFKHTTGPIQ
jgi:hypothetical protein